MSHPEPQPRPDQSRPDQSRPDYPYGPEAGAPRSPWPGAQDAGAQDSGAESSGTQPSGGGWGAAQDPWRQGSGDPGAVPVRYTGDADQPRYDGGAATTGGSLPTSTVVLLVVSGLAVFTGFATLAGVPALVLAVVAATSAGTDRERAERLTRTGWIVFTAVIVGSVLLVVLALVLGVALLGSFGALVGGALGGF